MGLVVAITFGLVVVARDVGGRASRRWTRSSSPRSSPWSAQRRASSSRTCRTATPDPGPCAARLMPGCVPAHSCSPWRAASAAAAGRPSTTAQTDRTHLTIYSGLPLRGPGAAQSRSIVNGEKLALAQARGRIGRFKIVLREPRRHHAGRPDRRSRPDVRQRAQGVARTRRRSPTWARGTAARSAVAHPDPQRGRDRRGLARRAASPASPAGRAPTRASRRSTTRPASARSCASCPPTTSRPRRSPTLMLDKGCRQTFLIRASTVFGRDLASQFHVATTKDRRPRDRPRPAPAAGGQGLPRRRREGAHVGHRLRAVQRPDRRRRARAVRAGPRSGAAREAVRLVGRRASRASRWRSARPSSASPA